MKRKRDGTGRRRRLSPEQASRLRALTSQERYRELERALEEGEEVEETPGGWTPYGPTKDSRRFGAAKQGEPEA
jgi:hypothetical protein